MDSAGALTPSSKRARRLLKSLSGQDPRAWGVEGPTPIDLRGLDCAPQRVTMAGVSDASGHATPSGLVHVDAVSADRNPLLAKKS